MYGNVYRKVLVFALLNKTFHEKLSVDIFYTRVNYKQSNMNFNQRFIRGSFTFSLSVAIAHGLNISG